MLNINDLPKETQEAINAALRESPDSITADQLAFLRARRDYLTADQRHVFGLDEAVKAKSEATEPAGTNPAAQPVGKPISKMTIDELKAECQMRSLVFPDTAKKADLVALLQGASPA